MSVQVPSSDHLLEYLIATATKRWSEDVTCTDSGCRGDDSYVTAREATALSRNNSLTILDQCIRMAHLPGVQVYPPPTNTHGSAAGHSFSFCYPVHYSVRLISLLGGVNHCSLHYRLAKFRGLMIVVKYGAVIGRETRFFVCA